MAKFRLLVGSHVTGNVPGTFEIMKARAGDIVESSRDLVAVFGPERFEFIEGDTVPDAPVAPPTVHAPIEEPAAPAPEEPKKGKK